MGDEFEKRGVTLSLLRAILDEALRRDDGAWSVNRVSALLLGCHEILDASNRWGVDSTVDGDAVREGTLTFSDRCCLIDVLSRHHRQEPHPVLGLTYSQCVAPANVFVSFAYDANFAELVDALECYLEGEGEGAAETTFFWFDPCVNNQWVAAEKEFEWWATTFRTAIQEIGKTVLVLLPWHAPIPLTRAWCLFEIYCSTNLSIALSRTQQRAFRAQLLRDVDEVATALAGIDLAKASAFRLSDKQQIFEVVGGGIHAFNASVLTMLRGWLVDTALSSLSSAAAGGGGGDSGSGTSGGGDSQPCNEQHYHCLAQVADLLHLQGDLLAATDLFQQALAGYEADAGPGADADSDADADADSDLRPAALTEAHLRTLHNFAGLLSERGLHVEAGALYSRALRGRCRLFGPTDRRTLETINNQANLKWSQGLLSEAETLFTRALEGQQGNADIGPSHTDTLNSLQGLALCLGDQGRLPEALALYERAREGYEEHALLGPTHPKTLGLLNNLAALKRDLGQADEAESLLRACLERSREQLGPGHMHTLTVAHNLAVLLTDRGGEALDEARGLFALALQGREAALGPTHLTTLLTAFQWAAAWTEEGNLAKAEELTRRVLAGREGQLGGGHADTLAARANLGLLLFEQGRDLATAWRLLRESADGYQALGRGSEAVTCMSHLAAVSADMGQRVLAVELYEEALSLHGRSKAKAKAKATAKDEARDEGAEEEKGEEEDEDSLAMVLSLAELQADLARPREAEALFTRCLRGREALAGLAHPDTLHAALGLACLLAEEDAAQGRGAEAEALFRRCLQDGAGGELCCKAGHALALLLADQGRVHEALPLAERAAEELSRLDADDDGNDNDDDDDDDDDDDGDGDDDDDDDGSDSASASDSGRCSGRPRASLRARMAWGLVALLRLSAATAAPGAPAALASASAPPPGGRDAGQGEHTE